MAKYSYITDKTHNNRKIQVESAKRDGSGKNFENNYAKQNGNYQSLTAGLSNNFDTEQVMVDESAYNFRPTATMGSVELEVGSPCKVKKIVGGSVAFNQLVRNGNFVNSDNWSFYKTSSVSVSYNVCHFTANEQSGSVYQDVPTILNHKYLITADVKLTTETTSARLRLQIAMTNYVNTTATTNWQKLSIISQATESTSVRVAIVDMRSSDFDEIQVKNIVAVDLTQMFGSTIADYIYSLEQANAGSGVAWFKRYFPKEYYAYNSGELVSVKTQGKKITHFNQWDEVVGAWGYSLSTSTGGTYDNSNAFVSSYIRVVPSTSYNLYSGSGNAQAYVCFYDINKNYISGKGWNRNTQVTTPSNCTYLRFSIQQYGTTYNHDICINFHYDGERDGEYEPYNSETYPCDDIELRGIPQLDENNNLAFDGDEYYNDGNVTRKYGIVDLGTLTWTYSSTYGVFWASLSGMKLNGSVTSNKYVQDRDLSDISQLQDKTIWNKLNWFSTTNIVVKDSSLQSTDTPSGYLVYELATPTDENSIPFTEVQECDNWGTEEWLAPTTDTRPCEVPVGHETDYLLDLKAKLEVAPTTPNENGVYVMEHSASGNSYTPLATWLQANGYVNEISANAIKENIGGSLRHQVANKGNIDFNNTNIITDLSSLSWTKNADGIFYSDIVSDIKYTSGVIANAICPKYKTYNTYSVNMVLFVAENKRIWIHDNAYTDATTFKNSLKDIMFAYEKAS